jgi:O-antigen ligase
LQRNDALLPLGLAAVIWFAALAKGAHDLWAVTVLSVWISLLTIAFLWRCVCLERRLVLPLIVPLAGMFLAFLVSSRYAIDLDTTHVELRIWFFSAILFYLFVNIFRDAEERRSFLRYAGLVFFPLTLYAIHQYLQRSDRGWTHWSAEATFANSAVLSGFALSWFFIFWHFRRRSIMDRCLFVGCLILLCLACSWWGFLSLIPGFLFYYPDRLKLLWTNNRRMAIGAGVVIGSFLLLVLSYKFFAPHDRAYQATDRLGWWTAGIRMFLEHPLVGVGLGGYATAFPYFKPFPLLNTLYAHSMPIQLLSETGLLGGIGAAFLSLTYLRMQHTEKTLPDEFRAYRAAALTLLIFSLMSIYTEYFIGKMTFFMAIAFTLCQTPLKRFHVSRASFALTVAGIFLIAPMWYLPFRASQYHVTGLQYENAGDVEGAETAFTRAIAANPYQDESYAALARLHKRAYSRSPSPLDLAQWGQLMTLAFRYKKDAHYVMELRHPPNTTLQ